MDEKEKKLTVVTLLLGRYDCQVIELSDRLKEYSKVKKKADIMIVADSTQWLAAPQLQMFRILNPEATLLCCKQENTLPAVAMSYFLCWVIPWRKDWTFCLAGGKIFR